MEHRGLTNTKLQLRPDTEAGNHRTYKHWGTRGNKTREDKSDNYSPLSKRDNPLHATSNGEGGAIWRHQGTRSRAMAAGYSGGQGGTKASTAVAILAPQNVLGEIRGCFSLALRKHGYLGVLPRNRLWWVLPMSRGWRWACMGRERQRTWELRTVAGWFWLGSGHSPDTGRHLASNLVQWCLGGPRDSGNWPRARTADWHWVVNWVITASFQNSSAYSLKGRSRRARAANRTTDSMPREGTKWENKTLSQKTENKHGGKRGTAYVFSPVFCNNMLGARSTQEMRRTIHNPFNGDSRIYGAQGTDKHQMTIKTGHRGRQWCAQASGGAGVKWRYEGTIADSGRRGRGCCSPSARGTTIHDFIRIFCHVVFLFCKLFEQYSQTNVPITKTKTFKVTTYLKSMADI